MALQIQIRPIEPDIIVLEFVGPLTLDELKIMSIESMVNSLLEADKEKLIFDLTGVERIDSTGLGIIVSCFATVLHAGGKLHVTDARGTVQRQFQMTRLNTIIQLFSTVEAACKGFAIT